ncbi:signal transduction histidine kinase [Gottschalkia purinilytica]|uniref:histidine kinase n=1 Tax=Gottschalkia purinilytica TaxID=1503 RepID=A0A0L0W9Q1_GOTPU|nr:HAMP domain-containing sensor histidine kinase [Gottschalkia purinilytica]KNF08278.1 signal transduction histidine kinase [Gottschalkia purinilytica]
MILFLFASICLNIILLIVITRLMAQFENISHDIDISKKEDFKGRILTQTRSKTINELVAKINNIIDHYGEMKSLKIEYERNLKTLISNISHDLRTPLTSLIGYMELIKTSKTMTKEDLNEYLNIIEVKALYLKNLVNNFFILSKLETLELLINNKEFNLSEAIRKNVILFSDKITLLNLTPTVTLPEKDVFITSDKDIVDRILSNLISNSIKYGREGKVIGLSLEVEDGHVLIKVWDKGIGIDEKDVPYIFDKGYRVVKGYDDLESSGIGLNIVKKLVEQVGGEISVFSKPYEKTVFEVKLKM